MTQARPTSVLGLLLRLLRSHKGAQLALLVTVIAATLVLTLGSRNPQGVAKGMDARFASFNIEFFPKSQRQVQEAFVLMEELGASAIGLQEIIDTDTFTLEAKRRLGGAWDFVFQDVVAIHDKRELHIGLLYNTDVFQLERVSSRSETRIDARTQPTLQVRLRDRHSGERVTMLVVHFKALPEGREQRVRQFAGLDRIVRGLQDEGRKLVVMGDFNATDEADRDSLDQLAATTGLVWATEDLPCSAFWERSDDCPTSRLDHIFTWKVPEHVVAKGGCEQGCEMRNSCPLYHREVSDHCPVVVDVNASRE